MNKGLLYDKPNQMLRNLLKAPEKEPFKNRIEKGAISFTRYTRYF